MPSSAPRIKTSLTSSLRFSRSPWETRRTPLPSHTYVAVPDGSTKAVVHGTKPDTPSAELMEDLQAKCYDILSARMLGGSETALVTFRGRKIPQYVKYICSYVECYPY